MAEVRQVGFPVVARFMLVRAPDLVEHIAGSITSKPVIEDGGEGGGGNPDKRKLPFNASAFDDSHNVIAILAGLCELAGKEPPSGLWRNADGRIVGFKGRVDVEGMYYYAREATAILLPLVDTFTDLDETDRALTERLVKRLKQIDARWPRHDTGTWLPHPCLCGSRIVVQPPVWEGAEQMIVCTGCGALYDEAGAARIRSAAHAVVEHEQSRRRARPRALNRRERDAGVN